MHDASHWRLVSATDSAETTVAVEKRDDDVSDTALAPAPHPDTEEPAVFTLEAVDTPVEVGAGNDVALDIAVMNSGEQTGTAAVTLRVNGKLVDSTAVSLAAGEEERVSLAGIAPAETGEVNLTVETADGPVTTNRRRTATVRPDWASVLRFSLADT